MRHPAGRGYVDCAIKPIVQGVRICGPAFTVQCHPKDNLMLHKALEKAQPGDIIVASVGGYYEAGYWGGLMATSAVARKIGGLAIDGCYTRLRRDHQNAMACVLSRVLHLWHRENRTGSESTTLYSLEAQWSIPGI